MLRDDGWVVDCSVGFRGVLASEFQNDGRTAGVVVEKVGDVPYCVVEDDPA